MWKGGTKGETLEPASAVSESDPSRPVKVAVSRPAQSAREVDRPEPQPADAPVAPGKAQPSVAPSAYSAYSALAVCGLSFTWLGALLGTLFIASAAQSFTQMPADVAHATTLARLELFTKIEIGLALSVALAQLYSRAERIAWIVYGCVLSVLLIEIGWLQPILVAEARAVVEGHGANSPMTYAVHLALDGGRAAGLLTLGLLSFRAVSARPGLGGQ